MAQDNTKETYINATGFQCLEHLQNNAVDIYLSTCGVQNCFPGHFYGPGQREEYIIHFICEGKGIYEVNGKTYSLSKGDFFVIPPKTEVYYKADDACPWDYLWVGFEGIKSITYLKNAGIDSEHLTGHYQNTSYILACIQQMMLARTLTYHNELKRQAALLQILAALIEVHHDTLSDEEQHEYPHRIYLQQALDYMNTHLQENIKISSIASHIGIDRSYLANIFKSTLEISPQEYLLTLRMNRAADLLQNTDQKITVIANEVGYSDPLTFTKMFKRIKGMSPSEWRHTRNH
ncbi:MAG: AraC family transcriptional regulator [Eubacterium sp.]|nr:AraC family transcriptional regulator [Eubacterium sp.]